MKYTIFNLHERIFQVWQHNQQVQHDDTTATILSGQAGKLSRCTQHSPDLLDSREQRECRILFFQFIRSCPLVAGFMKYSISHRKFQVPTC
jgi:hypothetical protein